MSGAPIDAVTSRASQESLLACIDEGRDAARHRLARRLAQRLVAIRAAREGCAMRVKWKTREHLAQLIAQQVAFEIQGVGRGAQALVARERDAPLGARPRKQPAAA